MKKFVGVVLTISWLLFSVSFFAVAETVGEGTEPFVYTDTESGVTFTVPANWSRETFMEDFAFIDTMFTSTKEPGTSVMYGSMDVWVNMPAEDRIGYTRSDLNNSAFTVEQVAQLRNASADEVVKVTYRGIQYFQFEDVKTAQASGGDVVAKTTQLVRFDNGWMYMFQLSTPGTDTLYADFESLMNSVRYPLSSAAGDVVTTRATTVTVAARTTTATTVKRTTTVTATTNRTVAADNDENDTPYDTKDIISTVAMIVFAAAVAVAVISLCTKTDHPVSRSSAGNVQMSEQPHETVSTPEAPSTIYCTQCGAALPGDSKFCSMCGVKLHRADDAQNDS